MLFLMVKSETHLYIDNTSMSHLSAFLLHCNYEIRKEKDYSMFIYTVVSFKY